MSLRYTARWAATGLSVHVLLVAVFLVLNGGNPQYFVHFGSDSPGILFARHVLGDDLLTPHTDGHDGQAYWLLARDPLLIHGPEILARNLDRPAYRAQRIGYPMIASPWLLVGETGLLWGLLATNLAVIFAGGALTTILAKTVGAPPRASLAFALNPGVLIATLFSLSDALALTLLLGTTLALLRQRHGLAVVCGVLGVLTKESNLIGLAGLAVLAPRLPARMRVLLLATPLAFAAGWGVYARWRLGWPPPQIQEFGMPFWGFVDAWRRGWSPMGNWLDALAAFTLLPVALVGILRWRSRRSLLLAGSVPFLALVPFLSAQVLDLAGNSLRVLAPSLTLMAIDYYSELGRRQALNAVWSAPS